MRTVRRIALAAALAAVALGVPAPAYAACPQVPPGGTDLPGKAGRDPVITRLGLERAWELSTGTGVTVSVVDTGVDARQDKLTPAMVPGVEYTTTTVPPGFAQFPGGTEDCDGHGTSVAGLIAARPTRGDDRVMGVAPGAMIAPVRVGTSFGQAPTELIAAAIKAGADRGRVLNLSFARSVDSRPIRDAITYALGKDVVVVAAAGNEGGSQGGATWYPAAYDGVLAVAALNGEGEPMQESNAGDWVDIAAPGEALTGLAPKRGYRSVSGTSFATALVSGAAALVRSRFPTLSAPEVVKRLKGTATPVAGGPNGRVGAGIVDPFTALTATSVGDPASAFPNVVGSVEVQPRPPGDPGFLDRWGTPLGWTGGLAGLALLALLARPAVRTAVRRRWRPGRDPDADRPAPPPPQPTGVTLL